MFVAGKVVLDIAKASPFLFVLLCYPTSNFSWVWVLYLALYVKGEHPHYKISVSS